VTVPLLTLLDRLVSQEVARANAAQASVRLIHNRRQLEDVEAFLNHHLRDQPNHLRDEPNRRQPTSAAAPPETGIGRRRGR
jgi:hypothetical protein